MNDRNQMVRNFIQSQMDHQLVNSIVDTASDAGYQQDGIDEALLEEFKNQVKAWCEIDTSIKRLQIAVRERKRAQEVLTNTILQFMQDNNIEDLNTKEGILRCKASYVKAPLSQKTIKTRLIEQLGSDAKALDTINKVFEDREKVEKVSLRRLRL
jgi:hypothetical protein